MRLRTRLFVWIGSLFAIAFVVSYILEIYLTSSSLKVGEKHLRDSILQLNETQRKDIQTYLEGVILDCQSQVNALLTKVKDYPPYRSIFAKQSSQMTNDWLSAATMLVTNDWVDFIRTQRNDQRSALISVRQKTLEGIQINRTDEGVNVLFSQDGKVLIGIPLQIHDFIPDHLPIQDPESLNSVSFLVLFTPETVKNFDFSKLQFHVLNLSINPLEPFLRWIEVKSNKTPFSFFIENLKKAQHVLNSDATFLEKAMRIPTASSEASDLIASSILLPSTRMVLDKLDQIGLIWGMTTLLASGPFVLSPFDPAAPVGIARVDPTENHAKVVFSNQVFNQPQFKDFTQFIRQPEEFKDEIRAFTSRDQKNYYFGNTLALQEQNTTTYVTLGIDGIPIQQNLGLVLGKISLFVENNQIIYALDRDAKTQIDIPLAKEVIEQMSQESHGVVEFWGKKYYFMRIDINPSSLTHYFLITPDEEAFLLVRELDEDVQLVISKISWQMRVTAVIGLIIVLIILNDLARKISNPITKLALATSHVKKGHLEEAVLPEVNLKFRDEVYTLYQSFNEMVQGLKEKERVRAVLNKVVSPEIAAEFLKQDPKLGGEEASVTVLFADIRSFTHLTEKMAPHEVIQLLNTCMTKVSHVIDQYHGVIDKYVGDEVMALFGAPVKRETSVEDAVFAAIDMVKALEKWNIERAAKGLPPVCMGFGIHVGRVVAGNMGAENRLNYTVLGSNVNLSSRICSVAKPMEILVTEAIYDSPGIKEKFLIEPISSVELKGFSDQYKIYRVKGRNPSV